MTLQQRLDIWAQAWAWVALALVLLGAGAGSTDLLSFAGAALVASTSMEVTAIGLHRAQQR